MSIRSIVASAGCAALIGLAPAALRAQSADARIAEAVKILPADLRAGEALQKIRC